ncbi:MAG: pilus assembly protein TadG-related protein, partial [Pseudomonadota bacterium]
MSVHISSDAKPNKRGNYLRMFKRDEEGGVLVLTLLLMVLMLVMGGMAVDLMRFEERRVVLQNVSDRAV